MASGNSNGEQTSELGTERIARRGAERGALRYDDGSFFALIENISDVIIATDAVGNVCYVSPSVERMLGYARYEVLRRSIFHFIHPDDEPSAQLAFADMLANPGKSGALTAVRARDRDGEWHIVEAVGKKLPEGETVVMSLRDITDRINTEEALRQSENKLRLHSQQTRLGVIEWDANLRITGWNPAAEKIFGYSAEEVLGQDARLIVNDEHLDFAAEVGVWALGDANTGPLSNENITREGRIIICDWCNTALKAPDGTVIGVVSLVEDVTEQRRMQEQLAHT